MLLVRDKNQERLKPSPPDKKTNSEESSFSSDSSLAERRRSLSAAVITNESDRQLAFRVSHNQVCRFYQNKVCTTV